MNIQTLYQHKALLYAEQHGITNYKVVSGKMIYYANYKDIFYILEIEPLQTKNYRKKHIHTINSDRTTVQWEVTEWQEKL